MSSYSAILYYIHDPMCSWCWGFVPVWKQVQNQLQDKLNIQYVLGGLAPDSDKPMPDSMQARIRDNWSRIQQVIPGAEFNYDFWTKCQPRRSTYPACRAIIACGMQQPELKNRMLLAIQQAYYLRAKNPSDKKVLIKLAEDIGLDGKSFSSDLNSEHCNKAFENDLRLTGKLGVGSFPGLVLSQGNTSMSIPIDYTSSEIILRSIAQTLNDVT